jgi:hypothetical protein
MGQSIAVNTSEPQSVAISVPEKTAIVEKVIMDEKVKALLVRLNEIKMIDKSNLKHSDLKKLRVEKRSIKHEFRETYRGHYTSVGSKIMTELMLIIMF